MSRQHSFKINLLSDGTVHYSYDVDSSYFSEIHNMLTSRRPRDIELKFKKIYNDPQSSTVDITFADFLQKYFRQCGSSPIISNEFIPYSVTFRYPSESYVPSKVFSIEENTYNHLVGLVDPSHSFQFNPPRIFSITLNTDDREILNLCIPYEMYFCFHEVLGHRYMSASHASRPFPYRNLTWGYPVGAAPPAFPLIDRNALDRFPDLNMYYSPVNFKNKR